MNDMFKAALLGGLILGVLSGIPLVNLGCCLWVIAGGLLAVFFYKKFSGQAVEVGQGALIGLFSGLMGAVIASILGAIFNLIFKTAMTQAFSTFIQTAGVDLPAEMALQTGVTVISFIVGLFFSLIIFAIFGLLGGIIGAAIFGKK